MDKDINVELPYDLRQVYAVDILGESLKDVARARKADNYPNYFKCLKDLWIVAQHKIKDKKVTIEKDNKKVDITAKEYYDNLIRNAVKIINTYPNEFLNKGANPDAYALIEEALNSIETFLYDQIENAKLFGIKYDDEGL